jgi:hypothetical protein
MALLLATRRFHSPGRSLLFGGALGLGVLLRPHSLFWSIAPTLLVAAAGLLRPEGRTRARVAFNCLLGAALSLLVSAIWWGGRLREVVDGFRVHRDGLSHTPADPGIALPRYLMGIWDYASPLMVLLAAVGAAALLSRAARKRRWTGLLQWARRPGPWVLALWFWSGVLIHSGFVVLNLRYMLPALPVIALLAGLGLEAVPHRPSRRAMAVTGALGGALICLLCSFSPRPPGYWLTAPPLPSAHACCGPDQYSGPPAVDPGYQVAAEVVRVIGRRHPRGRRVLVRLSPMYSRTIHPLVVLRAHLRLGLPEVLLTGEPFEVYDPRSPEPDLFHVTLGGESFPPRKGPHDWCYDLRLDSRPPRAPARLLLRRSFRSRDHSYRLDLRALERCPP